MTISGGSVFFLPMFFVSSLVVLGAKDRVGAHCTITKYWCLDTDRC